MHQPNQHPHGQSPQGQPAQQYQAQFQYAPQPPTRSPAPNVKAPSALLSPFLSLSRDLRGLLAVPLAFFGGIFGSIVLSASLVFAMWWMEQNAEAAPLEEEDEFLLEFQPGALTKLGVEPKDIPEKAINEETRTPEDVVKEAVTEEEKPPEEEIEKKPIEEKPKDDKPINKNKDAKISDKNRTDNNPYDKDLPNNIDPTGDPFGDPNGWSDLKKDGDPWATSVMAALNGMKVPAWAAKLPSGKPYQFRLKICKDGTVSQVMTKSSSGNADLDGAIKGELERLKIPKPPANVASKMKSSCVTLNYLFSWSAGKVK
ncbi:MAG TPA: TonB C-terminal domain-containing protein [Enhygromyxa sp.]|nr:TonB C-terminal domain-containing protein [Enhygromyxa sp.]